ncbi:hypothetical protein QEN19_003118 [Hanseniaspora menglaensis]
MSSSSSSAISPIESNKTDINQNTSGSSDLNNDTSIGIYTVLPDHGVPFYRMKHYRKLMLVIFIISLSSCNTGYDGSLLNSLYTEDDFNNAIGNVGGAILGSLTNGFIFGCLISSFGFSALVNEKLGRKKSIIIADIIMIVGVLIQSVSGAWMRDGFPEHYQKRNVLGMMIGSRIIVGIGSGIMQLSAPALIAEIAYPEPSARSVQINYYNSNWYLGAIVAAWIAFGVRNVKHHWSWRIPTILQCLFAVIQVIMVPFVVPESPRWLISQGRFDEARTILDDLHAGNLENGQDLVEYEMTEIQLSIQQERAASNTTYKDLLKGKANLKRMWIVIWIAIFMQMSGNSLVSYYLGRVLESIGYTSTKQQLIINACLMIYNLGVCIIQSFWMLPLIKKRVLLFKISVAGMLVSYIIWTAISARAQQTDFKNHALGQCVLAFIFIYYFFYNLGMNGLPFTYVTEILPFTTRSKGLAIFIFVQYIGQLYNGFVSPIAMDAILWKYYIVFVCILSVELVICFTLIETSGKTLEEVSEVFGDGVEDLGAVSGISALTDGKKFNKAADVEFVE